MEIEFTKHALFSMRKRNISENLVRDVVNNPDRTEPASKNRWCVIKKVGKMYLRVVLYGNKVITVYYDRRIKE